MRHRLCRTTGVLPISRSGTLNAEDLTAVLHTLTIFLHDNGALSARRVFLMRSMVCRQPPAEHFIGLLVPLTDEVGGEVYSLA
jgi:hypothetical protein